MKILIVDTQEVMRRSLRDFLDVTFANMAILEAGSAAQALELCLQHRPGLLVLDVSLLDGNGIELTERIISLLPDTPVIVISQHSAQTYVERAMSAGAFAYVAKHRVHRELIPAVERALAARHPGESFRRADDGEESRKGARESASFALAEIALRESERRLRAIIENEPECVKVVSREGWLLEMNPAGLAMLQAESLAHAQQQTLLEFIAPEHRAAFGALHKRVMLGESGTVSFEVIGLKGARRWLETRAVPLRDDSEQIQALLGVTRDITDRVLAERWAETEFRILEQVAKGAAVNDILDALCLSIETQCPGARCSIMLLDDAGIHLRHASAPSLPERYIRAIDGVAIGPAAGSCGTAAHLAEQVIVADISVDPRWREYSEPALREGLHACWCTPIIAETGKVLGTFAVYAVQARSPSTREFRLIERTIHLASITIIRSRNDLILRESEARFRQLAENIRDVFWLTDPTKNQMLYISPAYEEIWGRSCDSLYAAPRTWADAIHSEDRTRVLEAAQTRESEGNYEEEYRIVRPDGAVRWILDKAFPVLDRQGHVFRIAGIAEDITERKRAEAALIESEERYRQIVELSPDAVTIHQEGRWVFANSAAAQILGVQHPSQLLGQSLLDYLHPDVHGQARERWKQLYGDREPVAAAELKMIQPEGKVVYLETRAVPVVWNQRPAAQVVARDITERKQIEEDLLRFRMAMESSLDGLFLMDFETFRYLDVNQTGCRMLGYSREELLALRTMDTNPGLSEADQRQKFEEARSLGSEHVITDPRPRFMQRKDGTKFPIDVARRYLRVGDREIVVGIARDITERKQAEEALRNYAERLQGMSRRLMEAEETERRSINRELHDGIGQNLSALSLSLNLIRSRLSKDTLLDVGPRLDAAQTLLESTTAEVRNVMAGLHPPALDDYGLLAALRHYSVSLSTSAGLQVAVAGEEPAPRLPPAAEIALFRIAQGAITNAARHARAAHINVALSPGTGKVTLVVADDGSGFDIDSAGAAHGRWGLTIMRERAEAIGATLRIESAPGQGTRVTVETPWEVT